MNSTYLERYLREAIMEFNELQLRIIESSDNQELMKKAVIEGKFYVVATLCISGYSIGCFDDDTPAFTATKDESIAENLTW